MIAPSDDVQHEALQAFARDVRERFHAWVVDLILFGSRARGTGAPWSDWDILAVTTHRDRDQESALIDVAVGYLLSDRINLSVKIITNDVRELQVRLGASFMRNVTRDGRSLWNTPAT